ncbi:MAG: DUF4388 domain-containing protein [Planctomycetota bacterium]|nr:DUF4388 domain-containing protein [Planctomycetota bacterium]
MSIKGTLETFNLCELLQMLAFNQKEGTLVLEGEAGARCVYLDAGNLGFFETDTAVTASVLRMARFRNLADDATLEAARLRAEDEERSLLTILKTLNLLDDAVADTLHHEATLEQLFECQLTAVAGFEFVEGKAITPEGEVGRPAKPLLPVESMLLDLARMLDHWNTIASIVPGPGEIYEGTGIAVDLSEHEDILPELAEQAIPLIDGRRSLGQIAIATHATPYSVMQIAAILFEGGGIRAVPTDDLVRRAEDLLARGEAATTVALFQRCIDRGDADLDVRLRLADALEASGQAEAAAAELDTFAALSDDENAPAVFTALSRALRLRSGDLPTAARTCDFYLRRRPWLQEYSKLATQALRELITAATTQGRPNDAALRLQGFIEAGDAPPEDRILLADLYAAGGARKEAADALYRRSEDLLATDRTGPARQLLRRALELDPGHADARRRKMELEGVRRRRGHRARIALILLALGGVASAAGVAWFGYRDTSSTELLDAQQQATSNLEMAEERALALVDVFVKRAAAVEAAGSREPALAGEASAMREEVRTTIAAAAPALDGYQQAIEDAQATGQAQNHRADLDRLRQRAAGATKQAADAINGLADRAQTALVRAHDHHTEGNFVPAAAQLRTAWSLSFNVPPLRADAARRLDIVNTYVERHEGFRTRMSELTERGDLKAAFAVGVESLGELLDSDLTRKLEFPVRITSQPEGAAVWLGSDDTGLRTPCVLRYSPFAPEPVVRLRMGGRTPAITTLPSFASIQRDPASVASYDPVIESTLDAGPRWTVQDETDRFHALWAGSGTPLVAGNHGHDKLAVATRDGATTRFGGVDRTRDGLRMAGRLRGGLDWEVTGHRTLSVRAPEGDPWEQIAVGRIERAPIMLNGHVVLVDELGWLYAYRVADGTLAWRVELGAAPTQAPCASPLGILIATARGGSFRIDPKSGEATPLVAAVRGPALALPLGDHAVVLGGGERGCRLIDADGGVRVLGAATLDRARDSWTGPQGVAWIGADGTAHALLLGAAAPQQISALGSKVERLGGGEGVLYSTAADGRMRAVSLTTPDTALWTAPMGGSAQCPPIRLGRGVYVLVDGRLVAFDA